MRQQNYQMNIHSESIFHYTNFNTLKAILNDGCFRPSYCKEYLINEKKEYYVPMVSFCDIPLSQIPQLSNSMEGLYGRCAIGMNKNWSLKNGLNPVLYIHPTSLASHRIIFSQFTEPTISERESVSSKRTLESETLSKLLKNNFQFNKNFEGKVTFGNPPKTIKKYIFYKEREWRYVPNIKKEDEKRFPPIIFDIEVKKQFWWKTTFCRNIHLLPQISIVRY